MNIKRLNRGEAEKAMSEWISSFPQLPALDNEYSVIRNDLNVLFKKVEDKVCENELKIDSYYTDAQFGMLLYTYLGKQSWFSLRVAADDGFWRYLSLRVIPDIVAKRWGKDNESHYWSVSRRIWLKQLWWYIYLSWAGDEAATRKIVESSNCSTDTILNLVERSGKKGTCTDAYRYIMHYYSIIPNDVLSAYNKMRKKLNKKDDLFEVIMKLNTARMMVTEPELCSGGCKGYARKLFVDAGIDIDKYCNAE